MLIRFMLTAESVAAYSLYDQGKYKKTIDYCSNQLASSFCDQELYLIRGQAFLDWGGLDSLEPIAADWTKCLEVPHLAGVAHYYLGQFYQERGEGYEKISWDHYQKADELGWVEGSLGIGILLQNEAFLFRDSGDESRAEEKFYQAITYVSRALNSPSLFTKRRVYSIRQSLYFNLGNFNDCLRDKQLEEEIQLTPEYHLTPDERRGRPG